MSSLQKVVDEGPYQVMMRSITYMTPRPSTHKARANVGPDVLQAWV